MNSKQLAPLQLSLAPWADPEIMWIPSVCFIHFFHLSGRGEGVWMTRRATFVNTSHSWETWALLSTRVYQSWTMITDKTECDPFFIKDEEALEKELNYVWKLVLETVQKKVEMESARA